MAAGRLVVSHVSDQARDLIFQETGLSLPIVEANIDNIEQVVRDIALHPHNFSEIAAQGPSFITGVHDGAFSRRVLERNFLFAGDKYAHKDQVQA